MPQSDLVDRGIVASDVDGDRVDVGRDALRIGPQRQCGEGQQSGPGADVGDIAESRSVAFEPVERGQAPAGRRVLPGAEGEARVDLDGNLFGRHRTAMRRGMHIETSGTDRLESRLAHRYPVGLAQLLDARFPVSQSG